MKELACPSTRPLSTALAIVLVAVRVAAANPATAGEPPRTVEVRASTAYDHGWIWRSLFGSGWREVWSAQITVPVLDLEQYAGGLTPFRAGGNQTRTLRFHGGDGRIYEFRSTDKRVPQQYNLPGSYIARDQAASLHPCGQLIVAELQEAVGLLGATPRLICLPDDARLGEFRENYAHRLGTIQLRADEYPDGTVFADAEKIVDTESLLDDLEESSENQLDRREYLAARLLDFLVGDTDRGGDQWRFAKFDRGGLDVYRPVPRDHDVAFHRVGGLFPTLVRVVNPKFGVFDEDFPRIEALTYTTREFDRSHLVGLEWADWLDVVDSMKRKLADSVIDRAVGRLPDGQREISADEIAAGLRARRDALTPIAREFYLVVNREADVFGSDEPELVRVDRHADGRVSVRMWRLERPDAVAASTQGRARAGRDAPVFERDFLPGETREIRVYLERGDDQAIVAGGGESTIPVRVTGGEGDDVLEDRSLSSSGEVTHFHDATGDNTFVTGAGTRVSKAPFVTDPPNHWDEDGKEKELSRRIREERRGRTRDLIKGGANFLDPIATARYWGDDFAWDPVTGYRESGGVLLGFGPSFTRFGFRHQPYVWRAGVQGLVGTRTGELALRLHADRHFENSPWSTVLVAHASNLELNRFYGYGNDTPEIDDELSMIERFEVLVQPSVRRRLGTASAVEFGPVLRYVDPQLPASSPATREMPPGTAPFGQAGGRVELMLNTTQAGKTPSRGIGFNAGASAYPALWDARDDFGEAHATARALIPVGRPTLALRVGGQHSRGAFPLHESAFIGGRWTLRGFRWNRFAGDTSAYGSAELRVPVADFSKNQLGIIGFGDAGRVWVDDESAGGWHTGAGGGLWLGSAERQATVLYARGDEHRVYFYLGLPF